MMLYMAKYPEWNVMKMSERIGKNVSCYNREGVSQVRSRLESSLSSQKTRVLFQLWQVLATPF